MKKKSKERNTVSFLNKNLFRKMKLMLFLIFVTFSQLSAVNTYAQSATINLQLSNVSLKEAIKAIEKQTEFVFFYRTEELDVTKTVNLNIHNGNIVEVLNKTFSDYSYQIENKKILLTLKANQKTNQISGVVADITGLPLIGANIVQKGTTNGVITDMDGHFSLEVPANSILVVTYIGYLPLEVRVLGQSNLNIVLKEDVKAIEEVVVVGYGIQKKVTATGSVGKVEGKELSKMNSVNTSKTLQGLSSGLTVIDRGGAPGSDDPQIFLRGIGTTGSSTPLILVDGVEMSLSQVPSQEIESISVLKDAASASIYGSRAAHGVILVTTKKGKVGKMKLSYNGYIGFQDLAIRPKQVGAREYMNLVNEASKNAGKSPLYSEDVIAATERGDDPFNYPYVNYVDEVYKKTYITQHTVTVSGGNENGRLFTSFDYLDQPGLIKNTEFKRYNFRMNADLKIGNMLRLSSDISYRHSNRLWSSQLGDAQYHAFSMKPTTPVRYEDGRYTIDDQLQNPVANSDIDVAGRNDFQTDNILGQAKAEFEPLKNLIFTGVVALNGYWDRNKIHNKNYKFYNANNEYINQWNPQNSVSDTRNNKYELTLRFLANYNTTIRKKHSLYFLYGMEQISFRNYYSHAERRDLVSDALPDVSLGSANNQFSYGYPTLRGINSFFGRINYGYKEKYLFEANLRTDGSSRFAKGSKWGVFPSISGAWRLSEESFMKSIDFISNLKLRASWGRTGNENIGEFLYIPQFGTEDVVMNGSLVTAVRQSQMANPEVTWETVEQSNIGLDFAFFDNRLFGELDIYSKDTKDILINLAIPQFIGLSAPPQNAGIVRNSGFEAMLGYRKNAGEFQFSTILNIAYNKNRWIDRGGDEANIDEWNIEKVGYGLNSFYIYQADGLIANEKELADYKTKYKSDPRGLAILKPGDVKLVDVNNDGTIDPEDRQIFTGNFPKFTFGLNLNAEYKNFDLSILLQGIAGANRFLFGNLYEGPAFEDFTGIHFRDRWTEENQNGKASIPRLESADNKNIRGAYNSFYLKNITYLRLKNLQIGYTLPKSIVDKLMVDNLRVYLSGSNLLTFSGLFQGEDPEMSTGLPTNFPPTKIVNFGVNIIF